MCLPMALGRSHTHSRGPGESHSPFPSLPLSLPSYPQENHTRRPCQVGGFSQLTPSLAALSPSMSLPLRSECHMFYPLTFRNSKQVNPTEALVLRVQKPPLSNFTEVLIFQASLLCAGDTGVNSVSAYLWSVVPGVPELPDH